MCILRTIAAHQADRQIREFPGRRRRPSDFGGDMAPRSAGDRQATGSALSVDRRIGRRAFLKGAGALGAAGVIAPALSTGPALARGAAAQSGTTPLQHIIVDCQENRSFDHYYGFAPFAGQFGVPAGYSQPDGQGGSVAPFEFTSLSTPDIGHSWSAVHSEWDAVAMDGFFTTDGINCMSYYTAEQLPFYYSLFDEFTLCVNYFCSLLGPTWPNRFYLAAGTSGGITTNGVWGYGVFDCPIILDLLEDAGVTWKVYNISWDSVPFGNTDNVFVFWKRWAHDQRTRGSRGEYLNDLRLGRLPQVSFIVPSFARGWDEHPPADVSVGMGIQEELITALRESSAWESSAYILTYDEHGGYFDHVAPPQFDAYGAGGLRARLDVEAHRGRVRSADARLGQSPVRRLHAGRPEQRGRGRSADRSSRATAGRPRRGRHHAGVLRILSQAA